MLLLSDLPLLSFMNHDDLPHCGIVISLIFNPASYLQPARDICILLHL